MTPSLSELTRTFARIGCLSFGGPAAQIALMHRVVLDEKKMGWMPRSPNGIAMCQACDVKAQDKTGDGIHGRSYHHRH